MKTMISRLFKLAFTDPSFILIALGGFSAFALTAALISQYGFGLFPCELCLYQRVPYAVVILLAIFGVMAVKMMDAKFGVFNILLAGIAFLINSGIAFYHVGVEQSWWRSGCSLPDFKGMSPEEMMEAIMNGPKVSCDQIPFELFGISMAGYNVLVCGGLGIYCLIATYTVWTYGLKKKT